MKDKVSAYRFALITGIIVLFAVLRMIIDIPNVTPVMAMALLGGALISKKQFAVILPLAVLFLSDLVIGFYSGFLMAFVYGSFVIVSLIGLWLRNHLRTVNVVLASLVSSVLFFVLTNFGVWAEGLWYPMTAEGLQQCFALALPFFKNELAGTLVFSMLFFGMYQLSVRHISIFRTA